MEVGNLGVHKSRARLSLSFMVLMVQGAGTSPDDDDTHAGLHTPLAGASRMSCREPNLPKSLYTVHAPAKTPNPKP